MNARTFLFWVHLVAGVVAGVVILIMSFTGTVLAFEKELVAWAERDARQVATPRADTPRLSLDQMQERLSAEHPAARPASIIVQNDPGAAVSFSSGRSGAYYINPYNGDIREPASSAMSSFMSTMLVWHRYVGFQGQESRPRGKLIAGICNAAFCVLAVTGLYLWMPRTWSWRALRPIVWFTQNSSGKARDWNWHNVIGFWTAPILIVLTLTAFPISFAWAGSLIYTLTGSEPPAAPAARGAPTTTVSVPTPPPNSSFASFDRLLTNVQQQSPDWKTITLRLPAAPAARGATGGNNAVAAPVTMTVREKASWPRTANITYSLDPYTGAVLQREGHDDLPAARRVRAWTRFLHTGEAVGWVGQLVAGIASFGGVVLTWTGISLAWRRFFKKRRPGSSLRTTKPATPDLAVSRTP